MLSVNNRLRDLFLQPNSTYAKPIVRRIVLGLAFFTLYMIILSAEFLPDKVSLQVGQVSDRDVIAPRTVSYINTAKTHNLEAEVLLSVASVYDLDVGVMTSAEDTITAIFKGVRTISADKAVSDSERVSKLQGALANSISFALPDNVVTAMVSLDPAELAKAEEHTKTVVRKYLQRGIREDDLDFTRKSVVIEAEDLGLSPELEAVVAGISQSILRPNFILNVKETDKRKQAAIASIDPVRETVKKGQILVRRGDVVSSEQIHAMEELGLYAGQVNELRFFGLAVFVLLVMAVVLGYLYKFAHDVYANDMNLVLLGLIILVTLLIGKAAHYYSDFVAPIAAGALLTAILINMRVGLFISVAIAMLFGIIVDQGLRAVVMVLVGSMTGVYSVAKMLHGYSLTRTGLLVAVVNFFVIVSTGMIEQIEYTQLVVQGLLGMVSGIASAVITTGVLPYLEHTFNITTPIKLLDLAKPNHPLLQQLLLDAPGTYHHSVVVGNMAESAADAIGADPVTARVGAYYHDIGKIKRPYFFIENQVGDENPHDKIAPSLSTLIVTSHVKDGYDLCVEYKLPQAISDIVQQHHGTMLVSYFYKRATENEHGDCVIEADFRYEGPRPQSKEAALVMLADACEAAVRSISKPNINRVEATVRKLIRERLHDGQLDECNLTLKDLNAIGDVYIRILSSMFHTRIEYPDAKDFERRNKIANTTRQLTSGKDEFASGANCK